MSGTMESLRRKIDGAGDLEGVVRSMKALAASSIGQYEKAVQSLDDYYRTLELALVACLHQAESVPFAEAKRPPREGPHEGIIGALVFGSDQGLVGRFNEVVVEFAVNKLRTLPGKTTKIWAVGDRAHALMVDTGMAPVKLLSVPTSVNAITPLIGQILIEIEAALDQGNVVEVYVFHNHPKFGAVYEPVSKRLLPLDQAWQTKLAALPWPTKSLPEVIEGATSALHAFVRGYVFVLLLSIVRRIPCQRKRQSSGGDATRGKEYRRNFGRSKPHIPPCSTGIHRRRAVRRDLRLRGADGTWAPRLKDLICNVSNDIQAPT